MKVKNHRNFAFTNYVQKSTKRLGEIVKKTDEDTGEIQIGVIIQNHGDGEYRVDKWGNCSESEITKATKAEIKKYDPLYLEYIDKDEPRFEYWQRTTRLHNADQSSKVIDVSGAEFDELNGEDMIYKVGKKYFYKACLKMTDWLIKNDREEKFVTGLERYPEFKKLVMEVANEACKLINAKANDIKSDMPYKAQFTLEEVIQELQKRV